MTLNLVIYYLLKIIRWMFPKKEEKTEKTNENVRQLKYLYPLYCIIPAFIDITGSFLISFGGTVTTSHEIVRGLELVFVGM